MKTSKRGFTLIEVLVVLSVGGLLTGLAIQILERALSTGTSTTRQLDEARNLNRFADQFRSDMHQAIEVTSDSPEKIVARLQDGTVTYSSHDGVVTRIEATSDAVTRNEYYKLGEKRIVSYAARTNPKRWQVTVQSKTGLKHAMMRTDRVVAAGTARRDRLTTTQKESQ